MKTLSQLNNTTAKHLTDDYKKELIEKLQNAFAEEICAMYAYTIMEKFLEGENRKCVQEFFKKAAMEEYDCHARELLERISQLGGMPTNVLSPDKVMHAKHKYITPTLITSTECINGEECVETKFLTTNAALYNMRQMELDAIETYQQLEMFTRDVDPTTNTKMKEFLAEEEEHLAEINDFIADYERLQKQLTPQMPTAPTPSLGDFTDMEF